MTEAEVKNHKVFFTIDPTVPLEGHGLNKLMLAYHQCIVDLMNIGHVIVDRVSEKDVRRL